MCATLYVGGSGGVGRVGRALDVLEVTLCMPEATKGELYLLDAPEVMRCVLLCMPEALEGEVWT